ncbi:flavohemoglobin [Martiniozyma asiatica (nom. inval.)]|nr:flavohemoglobin [Martiniozyma asiatica]
MASKQLFQIIPLTASEISFLQGLAPAVKEVGVKVTTTMYQYMFETYPEVKPYFNMTNQHTGRQPKVLAFSLYQYILHLNNLAPISGFVNQIVIKHCGLGIAPAQYPIVGQCLVHAFKEVLGPAADEHFVDVLSKAYGNLAQTLINAEEEVYKGLQWRDVKDFKVVKLVKEAEGVTSVHLTPVDGTQLEPIIPGQYITLKWDVNDKTDSIQPREYSISHDLVNNTYRISVRELENGKVSTFVNNKLQVGDVIPVHAPVGTMTYDTNSKKSKVAVLAGGIGITPMITIINAALKNGQSVELFYSNRNEKVAPFRKEFAELSAVYSDAFKLHEYISAQGEKLTTAHLEHIDPNEYDVYLLGPVGYMHEFKTYLTGKGVSDLKMEFFGPTDPDV